MTAREEDIDFLDAQAQVDAEWEEFMREYEGERAQGTINGAGIESTANQVASPAGEEGGSQSSSARRGY